MLVKQEKERRKLQISGKSSCMVALPKKWVKEMGLGQGSEVVITKLNSRSLLVNAQPDAAQSGGGREAVVDAEPEDTPHTIFRKVVSLYVLGYSRIIIEGPGGFLSSATKRTLKDMVRRHLIGTEGVAESRDRLTVHVLLGYTELSVENALRKMLTIIDSQVKDATQAGQSSDLSQEAASERQEEVGRFGLYVIRQLNLSLTQGVLPDLRLENRDTLGYILIARMLERIAFHAGNLTRAVRDVGDSLGRTGASKLSSMNETAGYLVDEAMLSLFKRDHKGADVVVEKLKSFTEKETDVMKTMNVVGGESYYKLHFLMDSQRRMAEYAGAIAEVVLDMTVERTLSAQELVTAAPAISYA